MKLNDSGIQPGLVVAVHGQMPFVIPVMELVNDTVKKGILHAFVGSLFRILVGSAEFAGAVAAVDGS